MSGERVGRPSAGIAPTTAGMVNASSTPAMVAWTPDTSTPTQRPTPRTP